MSDAATGSLMIRVNGADVSVGESEYLLAVLRRLGIDLPAVCNDDRLKPTASCRLCSVTLDGGDEPVPACITPVRPGLVVETDTAALRLFRATMLDLLARHVSPEAAKQHPEKLLHRILRAHDVAPVGPATTLTAIDDSHPLIRVDMSQCIACYRCVRICADVQGQNVWHAVERGERTHIVPDSGTTLAESSCVGCGACVDTCPTDALTDSAAPPAVPARSWQRTVCGYCGVGCELEVSSDDGRVSAVRPAHESRTSHGHACVKGRYDFAFNHAPDRARHPRRRDGAGWTDIPWADAVALTAGTFARIRRESGPDAIALLGSARATNEDNYLLQKFARVVIGTHNIDTCARVCHTPTAAAMKRMLGTGAATNSFDDIGLARAFLVAGANPDENHPVVGARIRQQVRQHGARLVVIDPRRTEMAAAADVHLALRPGTNIPLFHALAHEILQQGLADGDFLSRRTSEFAAFKAFVAAWPAEHAAAICGVDADDIRRAARLYGSCRPAMAFHGLGVTEHSQGTEGVMALVNLALLTGNIGRPGSGINPLRGQNNVQGGAHMGCDPGILTGSVAIEEGRALFESVWGTRLPARRGLNLLEMCDAAAGGALRALWVMGYDILQTLANTNETRKALGRLEFIVVQDIFQTETARAFGHVFLPAASVFERDGTFMNSERRIQRVRKVVAPPGKAREDWRIVADVAREMGQGAGFSFASAREIWDEVRRVWPDGAGISYDRLEQGGLQWPCPDESHPGTAVLHRDSFARSERAPLQCIEYRPTPEQTDDQYPLLLTTGRNLYQFNAGTMTGRSASARLRETDTLDISADDAARLGVRDGALVRVRSRYGNATLPARVSRTVKLGEVFATFHDATRLLNAVTSPHRDSIVKAPEYKVTAVMLESAAPSVAEQD